jgi:hypothetical protein
LILPGWIDVDHILSTVGEFGLHVNQKPSGQDVRTAVAAMRGTEAVRKPAAFAQSS